MATYLVTRAGAAVHVTPAEFRLLTALARCRGSGHERAAFRALHHGDELAPERTAVKATPRAAGGAIEEIEVSTVPRGLQGKTTPRPVVIR